MRTWDLALIRISERLLGNLTGCIQKLFTLEGRHLRHSRDLKNGDFYVGALVGEPFRSVPYGLVSSPSSRKFSTWKSMRGEGDMAKLEERPSRQDVGEGRSGSKTKRLPSIGETMGSRIVEDVYAAAKPGARNPEGRDVWERLYPKIEIDENPRNRKFRQETQVQSKKPAKPRSQPPTKNNSKIKKPVANSTRPEGSVFGRLYGGRDDPTRFAPPAIKAKPKPALKNGGAKKGKTQGVVAAPVGRGRAPRRPQPTDKDVFNRLYRRGTPRPHAQRHESVDGKRAPARRGTDSRRSKSMDPPKKKTVTFLPASFVDEPTRTMPRREHGVGPFTPHSNFGFLDRRASQSDSNVHDLDFSDLRRESFTILSLNTPVGIGDGTPAAKRPPRSRGFSGASPSPKSSSSSERGKPGRWSKRPPSQKHRSSSMQSRSRRSSSVRRPATPSTEDEDDLYKSDFESSGSDNGPSRGPSRTRALSRSKSRHSSPSVNRAVSRRNTPSKGGIGVALSSPSFGKGTPSRASQLASRRSFRVLSRTNKADTPTKQSVQPVYNSDAIRPNTGPSSYLDSYLSSYQSRGGETNIYSLEEERRQNLRNLSTGEKGMTTDDDLKLPDIRRQDSAYLSDRDTDLKLQPLYNHNMQPLQMRQAAGHDSGRHTKKVSEEKKRQKGIFTASEEKPATKIKEVDYDKDDGGVYRAKSQNTATMNATEINDNEDTAVELPVDAKAAEEIKDEEIMTLPLPQPKELQNTTLDDSTEMMSASQPCLEVEVDDKGDIQQITEEIPLVESSAAELSYSEATPLRQWTSRLPVYQAMTRTASCGKQENKPRFELPFLWQKAKSEDYGNRRRHHSPSPSAASAEYLDHMRERTTTPSSLPDGMNSDTEDNSAFKADWYDSNYQTNVCIAAAAAGNDAAAETSSALINSPTLSLGYEPKIPSSVSSEQDVSPFATNWNPVVHAELTDKNCSGDAFAEDATPAVIHYPYEFTPPLARRSMKNSTEAEIEKPSPRGGNLSYFTPRDIHSEYGPRPDSASSETSSVVSNRTFIGTAKNRRNSDKKRDNEESLLPKVASADGRTISQTDSPNDYIPTHDKPFDPFYDTNPRWSNVPSPTRNRERLAPIENNVVDQNNLSVTPRFKSSRERIRTSTSVDGERIRPIRSPALRTSESSTHNLLLVRDSGSFTKDNKSFDHSLFFTPRDSPRSKESSSVVISFPTFGDECYREEAEASLAAETKSPASKAASSSASTPRAHSSNSTNSYKGTSPAFDPFAMFNEEVEKQDKINAKCNIPILVGKGSETSRAKLQRLIKSAQISRQFERNLNTSFVRNHLTIQSDRLSCHDEGNGSAQPLETPGSGVSWSKLSLPDIRKSPGGAEHLNADKIADFPSIEQHVRKEKNQAALEAVADSERSQFNAAESQRTTNRSVDV